MRERLDSENMFLLLSRRILKICFNKKTRKSYHYGNNKYILIDQPTAIFSQRLMKTCLRIDMSKNQH